MLEGTLRHANFSVSQLNVCIIIHCRQQKLSSSSKATFLQIYMHNRRQPTVGIKHARFWISLLVSLYWGNRQWILWSQTPLKSDCLGGLPLASSKDADASNFLSHFPYLISFPRDCLLPTMDYDVRAPSIPILCMQNIQSSWVVKFNANANWMSVSLSDGFPSVVLLFPSFTRTKQAKSLMEILAPMQCFPFFSGFSWRSPGGLKGKSGEPLKLFHLIYFGSQDHWRPLKILTISTSKSGDSKVKNHCFLVFCGKLLRTCLCVW